MSGPRLQRLGLPVIRERPPFRSVKVSVQAKEITGRNSLLICSGQTPNDAEGGARHASDMGVQIALASDNVETVLEETGWQVSDTVQIRYDTLDVDRFLEESGPLMARLKAAGGTPASTLLGVSRQAFPELLVEIEAVALQ